MVALPFDGLVSTLGAMWAISQASAQRVLDVLNSEHTPAARGIADEIMPDNDNVHFHGLEIHSQRLHGSIAAGEFVVIDVPQAYGVELTSVLTVSCTPDEGLTTIVISSSPAFRATADRVIMSVANIL